MRVVILVIKRVFVILQLQYTAVVVENLKLIFSDSDEHDLAPLWYFCISVVPSTTPQLTYLLACRNYPFTASNGFPRKTLEGPSLKTCAEHVKQAYQNVFKVIQTNIIFVVIVSKPLYSFNNIHWNASWSVVYVVVQEKRIYDLKKKNQELEKFKFVLDYKIKELKKQIEPREKDIKQMREQIAEVCRMSHHFYHLSHSYSI